MVLESLNVPCQKLDYGWSCHLVEVQVQPLSDGSDPPGDNPIAADGRDVVPDHKLVRLGPAYIRSSNAPVGVHGEDGGSVV